MTNDLIYSNAAGERFQFLHTTQDTDGQYVDFVWTIPHQHMTAALHSHPFQTETIEVLEGELIVTVDEHERRLYAGDLVIVPMGVPHTCRSASGGITHVRVMFQPALDAQDMIATMCQINDSPAQPRLNLSYIIWPAATR